MKIALVGNNDGPLILAKSMLEVGLRPVCIGLQKPVAADLNDRYSQVMDTTNLFSGFKEPELLAALQAYEPDLLVNCFCNFKFKALLETYTVLNVHLAPLPAYRGRHPMHWALIHGEREFGVTIHYMDKDFDSGAILWQKMVPVSIGMSVAQLRQKLMDGLFEDFGQFVLDYQNGEIQKKTNDNAKATYAPRRYPEDSRLTEWGDRDLIFRKVMALRSEQNPAYLVLKNQKVPVRTASIKEDGTAESSSFASVAEIVPNGIGVRCTDGKIINLYGFSPEKYGLIKNQRIS